MDISLKLFAIVELLNILC